MFTFLRTGGKRKNARNNASYGTKHLKSHATKLLRFESLEQRQLLSVTWNGSVSNLWSDGGNWDGNQVPGAGADVEFPVGKQNPVFDSAMPNLSLA